jgi:hypothetical protein
MAQNTRFLRQQCVQKKDKEEGWLFVMIESFIAERVMVQGNK